MNMLRSQLKQTLMILSALILFSLPMHSQAQEIDETPSAAAMVFDGLLIRPLTLVATAIGTVVWVATLPFSLLGGNAGEAADVLVLGPASATFLRCLGCTSSGYKSELED